MILSGSSGMVLQPLSSPTAVGVYTATQRPFLRCFTAQIHEVLLKLETSWLCVSRPACQLCYLVVQLCCSLQGGPSIARAKFKEAWKHGAEKETVIEPWSIFAFLQKNKAIQGRARVIPLLLTAAVAVGKW